MIKKVSDGYKVVSHKGKNLGGPYKTRAQAEKRLRAWNSSSAKRASLKFARDRRSRTCQRASDRRKQEGAENLLSAPSCTRKTGNRNVPAAGCRAEAQRYSATPPSLEAEAADREAPGHEDRP